MSESEENLADNSTPASKLLLVSKRIDECLTEQPQLVDGEPSDQAPVPTTDPPDFDAPLPPIEPADPTTGLFKCNTCYRTDFPEDRIELHQLLCRRNVRNKERAQFTAQLGVKVIDAPDETWSKEQDKFIERLQEIKKILESFALGNFPKILPPSEEAAFAKQGFQCAKCLRRFTSAKVLGKHEPECDKIQHQIKLKGW